MAKHKKHKNKKKYIKFIREDGLYHDNGRHGSLSSGDINWSHFEY